MLELPKSLGAPKITQINRTSKSYTCITWVYLYLSLWHSCVTHESWDKGNISTVPSYNINYSYFILHELHRQILVIFDQLGSKMLRSAGKIFALTSISIWDMSFLVCAFQTCFHTIYEPLTYSIIFIYSLNGLTTQGTESNGSDLQEKKKNCLLRKWCLSVMSYWRKADELEELWKNSFRETTVGDCFYIMGKKWHFPFVLL